MNKNQDLRNQGNRREHRESGKAVRHVERVEEVEGRRIRKGRKVEETNRWRERKRNGGREEKVEEGKMKKR